MEFENQMPMHNRIKFDSSDETASIIKVIGVGGGGSNAVTYMFNQGIIGVDFVISNTDRQSLFTSPVIQKIQLGKDLTLGLGAGSKPEVGRNAALESADEIKSILNQNTKMLFITAGMGGGTGTGAAPVIANIAKEMGILTVAIVTMPFTWEGRKKREQAQNGIKELKKNVDSLLLISNDRLREFYGNLTISNAFARADDVLKVAAKGISDIVNKIGKVNVDFEDVNTVMRNSGVAIMGSGMAEGENRATVAIQDALSSPLLNDNNINGASNILLYITSGSEEITMDEFENITEHIQSAAGSTAEIIWGICHDDNLGKNIAITIVATGFDYNEATNEYGIQKKINDKKKVVMLDEPNLETPIIPSTPQPQEQRLSDEEMQVRNRMLRKEETFASDRKIEFSRDINELENISRKIDELASDDFSENEDFYVDFNEDNKSSNDCITKTNNEIYNDLEKSLNFQNQEIENELLADKAKNERNRKLKELSEKIGNKITSDIERMEREPAYKRKKIELKSITPATESRVSKYTLAEDEDNNIEIKPNNSFLHDNVD